MTTWIVTFVLYLFVKPDNAAVSRPELTVNTVPAAVNTATTPR
ncbi:hypothetical protein OG874_26450 [Nocardia sp. NBC_00565]|nr:hypothetical protein [Nocardia sp. NBC_00565]WUC00422.1 hypothetical protein OG874_26450 [Nocardia sp. NBC_00565]